MLSFVSLTFFKLGDNSFTILCWPLPYINSNQPQVYGTFEMNVYHVFLLDCSHRGTQTSKAVFAGTRLMVL